MVKDYYIAILGKMIILFSDKYNFFLLIEDYINFFYVEIGYFPLYTKWIQLVLSINNMTTIDNGTNILFQIQKKYGL